MTRHLTRPPLVAAAVVLAAILLAACVDDSGPRRADGGLSARKATIGGLEVTVTPTRLDSSGAEFRVVFDTHTGAPGIDVSAHSVLVVDGTHWADPGWSGDGPGGHHRSGILRFEPAGPAQGDARLTISGLERPLEVGWELPEGSKR